MKTPLPGTDRVFTSATFTLAANFEEIYGTGTDDINLTGNTDANIIDGNSGNNRLLGSSGEDTLTGNDGNDTLDGGVGEDFDGRRRRRRHLQGRHRV